MREVAGVAASEITQSIATLTRTLGKPLASRHAEVGSFRPNRSLKVVRRDGSVWTTDKDGIVLGLLAAEITAQTKRDPGEAYDRLTQELGEPFYERIDAPATSEQKALLKMLSPQQLGIEELAGEPIRATLTTAPGNGAAFGGIKVVAENGWFAVRPSGTEDVYKIYAESFRSQDHLRRIQREAQAAVAQMFEREKPDADSGIQL